MEYRSESDACKLDSGVGICLFQKQFFRHEGRHIKTSKLYRHLAYTVTDLKKLSNRPDEYDELTAKTQDA